MGALCSRICAVIVANSRALKFFEFAWVMLNNCCPESEYEVEIDTLELELLL